MLDTESSKASISDDFEDIKSLKRKQMEIRLEGSNFQSFSPEPTFKNQRN